MQAASLLMRAPFLRVLGGDGDAEEAEEAEEAPEDRGEGRFSMLLFEAQEFRSNV
jgi:hypothetical protein